MLKVCAGVLDLCLLDQCVSLAGASPQFDDEIDIKAVAIHVFLRVNSLKRI